MPGSSLVSAVTVHHSQDLFVWRDKTSSYKVLLRGPSPEVLTEWAVHDIFIPTSGCSLSREEFCDERFAHYVANLIHDMRSSVPVVSIKCYLPFFFLLV